MDADSFAFLSCSPHGQSWPSGSANLMSPSIFEGFPKSSWRECNPSRGSRESIGVYDTSGTFGALDPSHINLLGRYSFVVPDAVARGELRPLRTPNDLP